MTYSRTNSPSTKFSSEAKNQPITLKDSIIGHETTDQMDLDDAFPAEGTGDDDVEERSRKSTILAAHS